jgi:6-phosphofructokinase 1
MLRLSREDFDDPHELAKFAATASTSVEAFREGFAYLLDQDMLYRNGADAPKAMPAEAVA